MRPYFAIIVDSFRAAFASRVLYILLAIITLLFLAIAPIRLTETLDWKLGYFAHMPNPDSVVERLIEKGKSGRTKSVERVWNQLSPETQATVTKLYESLDDSGNKDDKGRREQRRFAEKCFPLVDELNEMIADRDFFRPDDWGKYSINSEAQELIDQGVQSLSEDRVKRLNRLLLSKALPALSKPTGSTMTIYYWMYTYDPYWTFTASKKTVTDVVSGLTTVLFDKFLLSIGLFIGIFVTANVIPQTFNPGSLNLLLSKPITRSGLFISRFVGGCTQVAICSVYLFVGTWLWLGLGIGFWERAFLWSVPIYIFVFAIYYSVSAFFGLLYRSPILSVVMTVVFWAVCYSVGMSHLVIHGRMQNDRIYDPIVMGDKAMALDGFGNAVVWDSAANDWSVAAEPKMFGGPEMKNQIAMNQWLITLKRRPYQMRPVIAGKDQQVYAGLTAIFPPQEGTYRDHKAVVGSLTESRLAVVGDLPRNAISMFSVDDGIVVVNKSGRFDLWDVRRKAVENKPNANAKLGSIGTLAGKFSSGDSPSKVSSLKLIPMGPEKPVRLSNTFSVAMNAATQEIAVHRYDDETHSIVVYKVEPNESGAKQYVESRSATIDIGTDQKMKCCLAFADNTIVVVAGNGQLVTVDATTMKPIADVGSIETKCGLETMAYSDDGKWVAMMFANQKLWLMDVDDDRKLVQPKIGGQGNVSSVSFDAQSRLCVIDRENRLTVYDPSTLAVEKRFAPADGLFEMIYRYAIHPIYRVFPKPGEFYKITSYLSSARDAQNDRSVDLIGDPIEQNPLGPLWSGLGFMVLMLALSCVVFHYKDF
jgi:ABC-type transport system involved in multi-copper enzyme maturation permease subunit